MVAGSDEDDTVVVVGPPENGPVGCEEIEVPLTTTVKAPSVGYLPPGPYVVVLELRVGMVSLSTEVAVVVLLNEKVGSLPVGLLVGLPDTALDLEEPAGAQLYHEPDDDGLLSSLSSGLPHVKLLEMLELPFGPGLPDHVEAPLGSSPE